MLLDNGKTNVNWISNFMAVVLLTSFQKLGTIYNKGSTNMWNEKMFSSY